MRSWVTFCLIGEEIIYFASGTVVGDNVETLVVHVEDQILTLLIKVQIMFWVI